MVNGFPVPTLVLQEIGVVVVDLGIVGQSLDSRPKINNFFKKSNKKYCLGMLSVSFMFYSLLHKPVFEMSVASIHAKFSKISELYELLNMLLWKTMKAAPSYTQRYKHANCL